MACTDRSTASPSYQSPFLELNVRQQILALQLRKLRVHRDLADAVTLALVQREGQEKGLPIRRQLRGRVRNLEVGISVLEIEAPQLFLVEVDPLGIVRVAGREKAPPTLLPAGDHFAKAILAERVIADEGDAAGEGGLALVDLENDVHPVLLEADDLRLHARIEPSTLDIEIENALPVSLRQRGSEYGAGTELQVGPQLLVRELVIPLESDPIDDRVLDHLHDERIALPGEAYILEKARRVEGFQAAIEAVRVERIAGPDQHVGADRAILDPLIAFDPDRLNGAGRGALRGALGGRC